MFTSQNDADLASSLIFVSLAALVEMTLVFPMLNLRLSSL